MSDEIPEAQRTGPKPPAEPTMAPDDASFAGSADAMNPLPLALHGALAMLGLLVPSVMVAAWVHSANVRLEEVAATADAAPAVAVAAAADEGYCSANLKKVLRRVLQSCGLSPNGARGCQPLAAKNVATLSGDDFNALFVPLHDRAGILQFDKDSSELDGGSQALVDKLFADQRGASYFFVVARASPEGSEVHNRELSQARGEAVLSHLETKFNDPDLDQQVGLLWLGEEFAQLDDEFCSWPRSRGQAEGAVGPDGAPAPSAGCDKKELNRSAFVAWIDCRL